MTKFKNQRDTIRDLFPNYKMSREYIEQCNNLMDITMSYDNLDRAAYLKQVIESSSDRCTFNLFLAAYDLYELAENFETNNNLKDIAKNL